jgi:hypothetical protein
MADKQVYKCLSPVGIHHSVEQHPISPRLDRIDGKNIYFSIGAGGDQDITIALSKALPKAYPNVNWTIKTAPPHRTVEGSRAMSEEEMKTTDAMIRGVLW